MGVREATAFDLRDAVVGSPVSVTLGAGWDGPVRKVTRAAKAFVVLEDGSKWTRRGDEWGQSRNIWSGSGRARLILDLAAFERELAQKKAERNLKILRRNVRDFVDKHSATFTAAECKSILMMRPPDAAIAAEEGR